MSIKILSLNVNGLRNYKKRQTIFHWLKEQNADLYLLQETHCESTSDINNWKAEWGGECFWSVGTNFSRGVATLVKPKLDIKISSTNSDRHGRFVMLDFEIDDLKLHLFNIYSPNNATDRVKFFKDLHVFIDNVTSTQDNSEVVIGGDFN